MRNGAQALPQLGRPMPERLFPEPRFLVWGLLWLALGFVIYATARPATALAFLPHSSNPAALPHWLKVALGPAPSFVHVTAFALMSGALVAGAARARYLVCAVWAAIEVALECAQHPAVRAWLANRGGGALQAPLLGNYLAGGTFDAGDLIATLCGAAFAAWFMTSSARGRI